MKKKQLITLASLVFTFLVGFIVTISISKRNFTDTPPPIKVNFIPYKNSPFGINFKYPDNWERQEQYMVTTGELVTLFPPNNPTGKFRDKVIISVIDLKPYPQSLSLDEYSKIFIKDIKNNPNKNAMQPTSTTLSHRKANTITYSSKLEGFPVQIQETWTVYNDKAYVITYIVDNNNISPWQSTVENMIKSFEINI